MSFEDLLSATASIYRRTNRLFSGAIAATMSPTYQPSSGSYFLLTVASLVGSGTITVSGLVGGVADTEAFSFSADGFLQGSKKFTSITGITSSGITSGTLTIDAVTSGGQEKYTEYLVSSGVKVRIVERRSLTAVSIPGGVISSELMMLCLPGADILERDIVLSSSVRYRATSVLEQLDFDSVHHKTAKLQLAPLSA